MKSIAYKELAAMPFEPIRRAISRAFIRWQVRSHDRHIDVLRAQIKNDTRALAIIERERALLARRLI